MNWIKGKPWGERAGRKIFANVTRPRTRTDTWPHAPDLRSKHSQRRNTKKSNFSLFLLSEGARQTPRDVRWEKNEKFFLGGRRDEKKRRKNYKKGGRVLFDSSASDWHEQPADWSLIHWSNEAESAAWKQAGQNVWYPAGRIFFFLLKWRDGLL